MASIALDRGVLPRGTAASLSLATVRPDGRPHVVPLWFLWDGDAIVVLSKPDAQKVRNLVAEPRAMVSVGQPGDADAGLLEVIAEVEADGAAAFADRLCSKYQHQLEPRLEGSELLIREGGKEVVLFARGDAHVPTSA